MWPGHAIRRTITSYHEGLITFSFFQLSINRKLLCRLPKDAYLTHEYRQVDVELAARRLHADGYTKWQREWGDRKQVALRNRFYGNWEKSPDNGIVPPWKFPPNMHITRNEMDTLTNWNGKCDDISGLYMSISRLTSYHRLVGRPDSRSVHTVVDVLMLRPAGSLERRLVEIIRCIVNEVHGTGSVRPWHSPMLSR